MFDYLYVLHNGGCRLIDTLPFCLEVGSRFYYGDGLWEVVEWQKWQNCKDDFDYEDIEMVLFCNFVKLDNTTTAWRNQILDILIS